MSTKPPGYVFGRPTKYHPSFVQKAEKYYQSCLIPQGDKIRIPYIEEFALVILDVDDDTVVEWAKEYPDFSAAIKKIMALQQLRLTQRCMGKNPTGSIFLLKANHGKQDKIIIETPGNKGQEDKLDKIASQIAALSEHAKSEHTQSS